MLELVQEPQTSAQAAWAAKKYCRHRVVPITILIELEKAHIK